MLGHGNFNKFTGFLQVSFQHSTHYNILAVCTYLDTSHLQSINLYPVMPKPSMPHWMAMRSGNGNAHPGTVNISIKGDGGPSPKYSCFEKEKS